MLDRSDWPKQIEMAGSILVVEATNEERLSAPHLGGSRRVAFSAIGESCELCQSLDGKVFLADSDLARRYNPPLHPNCQCLWVEVGDDEPWDEADQDYMTTDYEAELAERELLDRGLWIGAPPGEGPYEVLRVPAAPSGRDFTFRRELDPVTGEMQSRLTWHRERYELPGLDPKTVIDGVKDLGERWRPLGSGGDVPPVPPTTTPGPGPAGPGGSGRLVEGASESDSLAPRGGTGQPLSRNRSRAKELEAAAREMGVEDVDYDGYDSIGAMINHELRMFNANGHQPPRRIVVVPEQIDTERYELSAYQRIISYNAETDTLTIRPNAAYWTRSEAMSREQRRSRYWSTPDKHHPVTHDLAHCVHAHRDPVKYHLARATPIVDKELRKLIAAQVSVRAAELNACEFVAEFYTLLLYRARMGVVGLAGIDKGIIELYRQHGGIFP